MLQTDLDNARDAVIDDLSDLATNIEFAMRNQKDSGAAAMTLASYLVSIHHGIIMTNNTLGFVAQTDNLDYKSITEQEVYGH